MLLHKQKKDRKLLRQYFQSQIGCYSFAFNNNSTILFIGCAKGRIKIYEFNNNLKQVQTLSSEIDEVVFEIIFLKKSNELLTSTHTNIVMWNFDKNNFWKVKQSWTAHQKLLNCFIINKDEAILISGNDKKIKFWENKPLGWSCFQTIDTSEWVACLSLNISQTKLIANDGQQKIQVIEHQPNQQWIITQTIEVNYGYRLGFVNNNSFVFQPLQIDFLEIYYYDQEMKQFNKQKQQKLLQNGKFQTNFIRPIYLKKVKNILMVPHNIYISFFRINQVGEYVLQQRIKYNENIQNQKLSDDAQYLVTWEEISKRIYIRKLWTFE